MRLYGLLIAGLALGSPATAATVQVDLNLAQAITAAGALTTLIAICPEYLLEPPVRDHILTLEAVARMSEVYGAFFDQGVKQMTAEALRNPHACADAVFNNKTY